MNLPILDKALNYAEKYYANGYLFYSIIGLLVFGVYLFVRLLSQ